MKNAENAVLAAGKGEVKTRLSSKEKIEALKPKLQGILIYRDLINDSTEEKKEELRKEFKKEYKTAYSDKLIEKLLAAKTEVVPSIESQVVTQAEEIISQAAADFAKENEVAGDLKADQEYNEQAAVIDEHRNEAVNSSIKEAAEIAEHVGDKPTIEQMHADLELLSMPINVDQEPEYKEDGLADEILSKRGSVLEEINLGKHQELSQEFEQIPWPEKEAPVDTTEEDILAEERRTLDGIKEGAKAEMALASQTDREADFDNFEEADAVNVGVDTEEKMDRFEKPLENKEVLDIFGSLGLQKEDLETIPGLDNLNGVSVLMIAKSMKMVALEKAERNVKDTVAASYAGKNKIGRILTGIANAFRQGKIERGAIAEQAMGGVERHGADLTRIVKWAETFQMEELAIETDNPDERKFIPDYIMKDLEGYDFEEEEQALLLGLNESANRLASLPKYWQEASSTIDGPQKDEKAKQYELTLGWYQDYYNSAYEMLTEKFGPGPETQKKVEGILNKVDARVNMVQFMTANPDLEKEWQGMTKGNSFLGKMTTKENMGYFIGGGASRSLLVGAFGYVAAPLLAAAIGGWRGLIRAERAARKADRFVDKKDKGLSVSAYNRTRVLDEIKSLVPADFLVEPSEWLKTASPEEQTRYTQLKLEFNRLDRVVTKEQSRAIERKTESADDLMNKAKLITDKINQEADPEKRQLLVSQLIRRVNYNYSLAERGLVNFGRLEDRPEKMMAFYKGMEDEQALSLRYDETDAAGATYEIKWRGKNELKVPVVVDMEKRAEALLESFAASANVKLDKKRKNFIIKGMLRGATFGAAFATAGSYVFGHFDHVGDSLTGAGRDVSAPELAHAVPAGSVPASAESINISAEDLNSSNQAADLVSTSENVAATPIDNIDVTQTVSKINEVAESVDQPVAETQFTDLISNEGLKGTDSVWRSVKEIFINHPEKLGYTGDIDNVTAVDRWAAMQTNEALANSGDISDQVFAGNIVSLEQTDQGFSVSVEAGTGVEPGYLPAAEVSSSEFSAVEAASLSQENISTEPPINPEAWADEMGARYGLSSDEVDFSGEGVIKTNINGNNVFINPESNTYIYLDDAFSEHSGMLVDSANNPITDIKAFLVETAPLDPGAEESVPLATEALLNEVDLSPEGLKLSADNIGYFISNHSAMDVGDLHQQTLAEIQKATGLTNLEDVMTSRENKIFAAIVDRIKDGSYSQTLHQKELSQFIERLVDKHGI